MAIQKIEIKFNNGFNGELISKNSRTAVGVESGQLGSYDMLFGSLAACLYSTFLDVVVKKKITFDEANVVVTGEKRKEIPTTLEWVSVVIEIKNASNEKGINKAADLAAKYCSVYETISKVAKMTLEVRFI